ncbi:MAG: 3-isopropylmalate/(R)-2-methylmalate dehydratase small subunit [Phenylobacterium sp.]|jgi:3-isopropylmalate/(R)-2-methylmalate dehydratase small subunit
MSSTQKVSSAAVFHAGKVAPLDINNVDTDQIIPKQFLTSVSREGFAEALFYDWRYIADDQPNPEFVLNEPRYAGASVLLTRDNFGCGSSREHAPWALQQFGFEVIIASSFADIFFNNCINNQMLPIALSAAQIEQLFVLATQDTPVDFSVDLQAQQLIAGGTAIAFTIDPSVKQRLLSGLDFIGISEAYLPQIEAYEADAAQPWR